VSSSLLHLARRLPHATLEPSVKIAQSFGHRCTSNERAIVPASVLARVVIMLCAYGRTGTLGQFGRWAKPSPRSLGPVPAHHYSSYFHFSKLKSSRNSYNLLKFIVDEIKNHKNMKYISLEYS
jgi:hypothetical protein